MQCHAFHCCECCKCQEDLYNSCSFTTKTAPKMISKEVKFKFPLGGQTPRPSSQRTAHALIHKLSTCRPPCPPFIVWIRLCSPSHHLSYHVPYYPFLPPSLTPSLSRNSLLTLLLTTFFSFVTLLPPSPCRWAGSTGRL